MVIIKKVLIFNDISSFGKCSLTTIIPILSVLKIQPIPIVTSVLTTHTGGFKRVKNFNLTEFMPEYLKSYIENNIDIDAVYTGYFGNKKQCDIVLDYINYYNNKKIIVDPVMGDNGKIYSNITDDIINGITNLVKVSDIITPNLTEAKILLGKNLNIKNMTQEKAIKMLYDLRKLGPKTIIIKGITLENNNTYNFIYENEKVYKVCYKLIEQNYPGTGDIFCSIVLSENLNGKSVKDGVYKATNFLQKVIKNTYDSGTDPKNGVHFENYLYKLF